MLHQVLHVDLKGCEPLLPLGHLAGRNSFASMSEVTLNDNQICLDNSCVHKGFGDERLRNVHLCKDILGDLNATLYKSIEAFFDV